MILFRISILGFRISRCRPPLAETPINQKRAIMQNKPNLPKAQMNLTSLITVDYENKPPRPRRKNKPNSNPIQAQTNPNQSQFKPKTNPIKPKTNPIPQRDTQYEIRDTNPIPPHAKRRAFIPCLGSNPEYNVGTQYPAANQNMYALQKP